MAKMIFTDFGQASNAAFMGDFGDREHVVAGGAQLDAAAAFANEGDFTVHNSAAAADGATSITVTALPKALPARTHLLFSDGTVATTTTAAAAGATSIAVEPLGEALADESDAIVDTVSGQELVLAGTLVGRTYTEQQAGAKFGPAADADDEIYILLHDVDLSKSIDADLVRHGSLIKTNFLPSFAGASATIKGKLQVQYQLILG